MMGGNFAAECPPLEPLCALTRALGRRYLDLAIKTRGISRMNRLGSLKKSRHCVLVLSTAATCVWQPVLAQASTTEGRDSPVLAEILVAAQRREQSLQDVPLAVSAFDEVALRASGVLGSEQLGQLLLAWCSLARRMVRRPMCVASGHRSGSPRWSRRSRCTSMDFTIRSSIQG
jgi:hypothetical protein